MYICSFSLQVAVLNWVCSLDVALDGLSVVIIHLCSSFDQIGDETPYTMTKSR